MMMVALSGGVDSSVSAYLLQQAGYNVYGVFMKNWREESSADSRCPADQDLLDVVQIADHLGIPLQVVDFHREYREQVFSYFLEELSAGRTPNPDILCNSRIKFRCLLDFAVAQGASGMATGHYARILLTEEGYTLHTAQETNKDQSYFLYRLTQEQLSLSHFPLGDYAHKAEVRQLAQAQGLVTHDKKDSTGICFIGERAFTEFIQQFIPTDPGPIYDLDSHRQLGTHQGLSFYTLGQRKGLGIGGQKTGETSPWFVAHKSLEKNALYVVCGGHHPALYRREALITDCHWINTAPSASCQYSAKIRYRQAASPCTLLPVNTHQYRVRFEKAQRSITPGQALVVYRGTQCLGGGTIVSEILF